MARGKSRRTRSADLQKMSKPDSNQGLLKEIENHWVTINKAVPQLKPFVNRLLNLRELVTFWSNPMVIEHTRGDNISGSICGELWIIATMYLNMAMIREAGASIINGSFLHQCYVSITNT